MSGFWMVRLSIGLYYHSKTIRFVRFWMVNHLKTDVKNVRFSNVSGIWMSGIRIVTVLALLWQKIIINNQLYKAQKVFNKNLDGEVIWVFWILSSWVIWLVPDHLCCVGLLQVRQHIDGETNLLHEWHLGVNSIKIIFRMFYAGPYRVKVELWEFLIVLN